MGSVNQSLKKDWIFSYKLRNLEFIAGTEWGSSSEGILKIHHLEAWVCLDSWLASPRRFIGWSTLWLRSTEDFGLFYDIHGCSDSAFGFGRKKEDGVRLPQLPGSADHDLAALGMLKHHPGLGSWQLEKCGGAGTAWGTAPRAGTARDTLVCLLLPPAWFSLWATRSFSCRATFTQPQQQHHCNSALIGQFFKSCHSL